MAVTVSCDPASPSASRLPNVVLQGAIGSGTGILLAVTIIYQYFEVRSTPLSLQRRPSANPHVSIHFFDALVLTMHLFVNVADVREGEGAGAGCTLLRRLSAA
jgi:hypothetical protein